MLWDFANAELYSTGYKSNRYVTATGNITGGNLITGGLITATGNITGGNLVTSGVANVSSLSVTGTSNLGAVGNVKITGGTANYLLQTDGSGNLSWVAGGIAYASSSVSFSAYVNTSYILNTSANAIVVTLPNSPSFGQQIGIIDGTGNASTNNITVYGNGSNIQGLNSNMTVTTSRAAFTLVYYDATQGWLLTNV